MAQVRISRFKPDERAKLDRRVKELEAEVMRLEDELRFLLSHLDKRNFDPDVWKSLNGGGENGT